MLQPGTALSDIRPFIEKQYFSRFKNSLSWTLCNCRFLAIDENNCSQKSQKYGVFWNLRMMRSHKWKDRWGTNEEDEWILWKPCLKSVLVSSIKILFSFSIISFPLPSAIIVRASKTYFLGIKRFVTEIQKFCNRNPEQTLRDPLRRILDPWEETERLGVQSWSKKLVFVVTSILSSTSILLFHFLPLHSHFLSGLLVMLFYLGNIEQDTQDLQIWMNNIEKIFATDSFCYNWSFILFSSIPIRN